MSLEHGTGFAFDFGMKLYTKNIFRFLCFLLIATSLKSYAMVVEKSPGTVELIAKGGLYAHLCRIQTTGTIEETLAEVAVRE